MSVQEAALGSSFARLKEIHTKIDPLRLFDTYDGVGYSDDEDVVVPPSGGDDKEPPSNEVPNNSHLVASACATAIVTFAAFFAVAL